jgi:hypothetical protein
MKFRPLHWLTEPPYINNGDVLSFLSGAASDAESLLNALKALA